MNEEQQSTNEELESMNDELHERTLELDRVNGFLDSVLGSIRIGVIVLGPEMRVQMWNRGSEDLWGLRADEVIGKHFLNLDFALELESLRLPIRAALSGEIDHSETIQNTLNRRGKSFDCKITMVPRKSKLGAEPSVILLMEKTDNGGNTHGGND
jgi:two-component system CheB/CheR fusion protein